MESNLKIKEDVLLIERDSLSDQIKNLDQENWKTNIVFVASGLLLDATDIFKISNLTIFGFLVLLFFALPFIISTFNLASQSVKYHSNLGGYFKKGNDYEQYLNEKKESFESSYQKITKVLEQKAFLNKLSLRLLSAGLILIIISKI